MTEKVKTKIIELMYSWSKGLQQEGKIVEAYQMLKRQGIIKEDPTYVDQVRLSSEIWRLEEGRERGQLLKAVALHISCHRF